MKKLLQKVAVVLLSAVFLTSLYTPVYAAETSKVVVHVKDGASWGSMNVYNWGDDGETAGVWPGTAMAEEGDGWYTYTFETKCDLNLVFSAQPGKPQSSNVDPIAPDAGEVWVVIGGESDVNELGADTVGVTLYTTPEEGWPSIAATDTAADTADTATDASEPVTTSVPKTGESQTTAAAFLGLAVLSAAVALSMKKKRVSEN